MTSKVRSKCSEYRGIPLHSVQIPKRVFNADKDLSRKPLIDMELEGYLRNHPLMRRWRV